MPTYKTKLKRGKDGQFTKYVGKTQNGVKTKFKLGFDPKEADSRLKLIQTLWNDLESRFPPRMTAYWDKKSLDAARLIAKGKGSCVPKRDHEMHEVYVERLARMSKEAEQPIFPTHLPTYQLGLQRLR